MVALHCIDDAGTRIALRTDVVAEGFRELGCYHFFSPLEGASLYIDEALAEPVQLEGQPCWRWQPGFYAGQVVAELVDPTGRCHAEYRLDVGPDASKLGADVFNGMLDDLYAFDPVLLLGSEAAQADMGVSGAFASPLLAYARLRRYGYSLATALRAVASLPLTRLQRERSLVPCHRVRRLDTASARALLRRPETAAFVRGESASSEGAVPLFDVVRSIDTLDNPANRALTAKLLAVRRRCVQVADELRSLAEREEETGARTALRPRIARKLVFLDGLAEQLAKIARLEPYVSVSRVEVTAAGLNAISAHPAYARAYRFAWSALRPGIAGAARDESLWLSPTWEIYERWCFTRVAACLREKYSHLSWVIQYPGTRNDCIRLVGTDSSVRIEASLQRCFRSGEASTDGLKSVSLQLQPDLLITMDSRDERRMLVLDAKYRTSRQNVLDSMRSAHLYQDALRWDGERAVCSLLLVPRGAGAPWLEEPEFQSAHRVGVHVLAPDSTLSALDTMLERWLAPLAPITA